MCSNQRVNVSLSVGECRYPPVSEPKNGKPDQTTLRKASLEEIGEAAGVPDVERTLLDWGAERVGRRDELGWPAQRKDAFEAVRFPEQALWVPVAGLLLSVVLPLARRRP